jgi:prevent-host-death family protein
MATSTSSERFRDVPDGIAYAGSVDIETRTADQVRIPKVSRGRPVVVTRHGAPIAAIVDMEDFRLIQLLREALPAVEPMPASEAAVAAWAEDPAYTEAELESMRGLRPCI